MNVLKRERGIEREGGIEALNVMKRGGQVLMNKMLKR